MAKKKKWKKRLKKLAKAALIGGALYGGAKLLKNRRAASIADTDDAGIGVTHPALKDGPFVTKKTKVAPVDTTVYGGGVHRGHPPKGNIVKRMAIDKINTAEGSPSIDNPYGPQRQGHGPRRFHKGGGRVKSMGIAKRGGGIAKR